MTFKGKNALVTGSSRGIGRGIALKLAELGARVAVHYYQNEEAAKNTLAKIRECGSDGFLVQADVCRPQAVKQIFTRVEKEFGSLDIFVSNARTEAPTFYQPPMEITLEKWNTAVDSQATAFLVGVREAERLMPDGGRIIAISYAPGGRFGSWQPWVAMGAAKAAMEVLTRYFAVALAGRGITVNTISPGWVEDSVVNSLPSAVQDGIRNWQKAGWTPMCRMGTPADIGNAVALLCSEEAGWITGQTDRCRWGRIAHELPHSAGDSTGGTEGREGCVTLVPHPPRARREGGAFCPYWQVPILELSEFFSPHLTDTTSAAPFILNMDHSTSGAPSGRRRR